MASETIKIGVILEGDEEECLFDIVSSCLGFGKDLDVVPINAGGAPNVPAYFQDCYTDPSYDCVVAVYDTDNRAKDIASPFSQVKNKLEEILGDSLSVEKISFCTNPTILQLLLLGCDTQDNVALTSSTKSGNSSLVSKYWPKISKKYVNGKQIKKGYDASKWQLEIIKNSYIYNNEPSYEAENLLSRSLSLSFDYLNNCPAGNVGLLIKALVENDKELFEDIKKHIY